MRHRVALGLLVTVSLAFTGSIQAPSTPRVELSYRSRFGDTSFRAPDTVIVGPRAITVRGRFDLPGTSHALAAVVQELGSAIILDLTSYPRSDAFGHMVDPVEFEAKVVGLQPGPHAVYVRRSLVGGWAL